MATAGEHHRLAYGQLHIVHVTTTLSLNFLSCYTVWETQNAEDGILLDPELQLMDISTCRWKDQRNKETMCDSVSRKKKKTIFCTNDLKSACTQL